MNVASLSLCRELHKLSGWVDIGRDVGVEQYTLVYLLNKLPKRIETNKGNPGINLKYLVRNDQWICGYRNSMVYGLADNPTDAACKLAIELWKSGVLK